MDPREWLAGVVAGAEKIPREEVPRPSARAYIVGSAGMKYGVGKLLGASERFNLYECVIGGSCGILKIAKTSKDNESLDREALVLRLMTQRAEQIEVESPGMNYTYFFPKLYDSFIAENQEGRRINILGFPGEVRLLDQLTPMSALHELERVRVDPKTSAWMLGKILKLLAFAHDQGISNRLVTGSNILIERNMHGVIVFDWMLANIHGENRTPQEVARGELSQVGREVTLLLGGDLDTGKLPESDQLTDKQFEYFIHWLTLGGMSDAAQAHREFYKLVWTLWPRQFHPFTTYKIDGEKEVM